jgi:hypothetical protein
LVGCVGVRSLDWNEGEYFGEWCFGVAKMRQQ